ncbi:hypothetical protein JOM56_011453, partial [Amanita muscaria]
ITNQTKTQNDFLLEWIPWRSTYLSILLESEGRQQAEQMCEDCLQAEAIIRCLSCHGHHLWCSPCAVKAHTNHPFHRVERWTGQFYQAVSLLDLGFTLNLGHGGRVCPNNMEEGSSDWSCHRFTILDSAGIFVHHVRWCRCNGVAVEDKHLQLVRARLFPSSITKPQTAFTFDVLDQFLIDALECKTSAMSFYQKLRWLTDNAFPNLLPDRYRELMRVSRVWRDLSNRKRAGFGHDAQREPGPGELAIFCPACPQPGINLPERWSEIYDRLAQHNSIPVTEFSNTNAVALRYVLDGNFTAQHMKMKRPEDNVALSDGLGYMVNEKCYQSHIRSAADNKDKSACHNHRVVNSANTNKSNLRATGIGATACARHGCFVPHSVVDFYKGEQQKNIDYSVCQAIRHNSDGLQKALIIYDVACQWYTKFQRRVESYSSLSLPEGLEIVPAVGKFHLSAHKLDCFARFSLMFTRGAGHIDGEILETLWSSFNKVSPTARSMSLAHRQELYDDHMRDSNWKKLVGLVKALCKKHKAACNGVEATKGPFEELTTSLDDHKVRVWIKVLHSYSTMRNYCANEDGVTAPTLAEIRLNLVESGMTSLRTNGSVNWLVDGISIENAQDALRAEIRCLSSNPTTTQKTVIAQKRQRLLARITNFNEAGDAFTGGLEIDVSPPLKDNPGFCREENGDELDDSIEEEFWQGEQDEDDDADDGNFNFDDELIESNPEIFKLWMPSSIGGSAAVDMGLEVLVEEEIQLRVGQANDCLDDLRTHLGHKSVLYRMNFRSSTSVRSDTRSKQEIRRLVLRINQDVRGYHQAREALISLGASEEILQKYQLITLNCYSLRVRPLFFSIYSSLSLFTSDTPLLGLTAFLFPRTAIAVLPSFYCSLLHCTYI